MQAQLVFDRPMLDTLLTLLIFQTLGEGLVYLVGLPVPGPVIGMLLLLGYLILRKGLADRLAPSASQLLAHMALLFVPAGVGISVHFHRIADEWFAILVSVLVSTLVSIMVTALVIRWLSRMRREGRQ